MPNIELGAGGREQLHKTLYAWMAVFFEEPGMVEVPLLGVPRISLDIAKPMLQMVASDVSSEDDECLTNSSPINIYPK